MGKNVHHLKMYIGKGESPANHVSLLEVIGIFWTRRNFDYLKKVVYHFWFEGNWIAAFRRLVFQLLENVHPFFFGWIELKKIFGGRMDV